MAPSHAGLSPDINAWAFLMGNEPVRPYTLLLKMVEEPLTMAMHAMVTPKKPRVQEEVSTFTSTIITTKMASETDNEARTRTFTGTLGRGPEVVGGGWTPLRTLRGSAGESQERRGEPHRLVRLKIKTPGKTPHFRLQNYPPVRPI